MDSLSTFFLAPLEMILAVILAPTCKNQIRYLQALTFFFSIILAMCKKKIKN